MFGDICKQLQLLTLDLGYCQESNPRAYGRPRYQRQTITLALAHACPLTAVEVSLSSLASSCPRACYIALHCLLIYITNWCLQRQLVDKCTEASNGFCTLSNIFYMSAACY